MTQQQEYTFNNSSSTPEETFTEWFNDEREPLLDDDVDECIEDDYSDDD